MGEPEGPQENRLKISKPKRVKSPTLKTKVGLGGSLPVPNMIWSSLEDTRDVNRDLVEDFKVRKTIPTCTSD